MIPESDEYLSFLMAAPDISDEELSRLGIEILETHGSGIRGLRIPGSGLPGYKALIRLGRHLQSGHMSTSEIRP